MTTSTRALAALTASVLTLGLTACGGDDGQADDSTTPTTTEATNQAYTLGETVKIGDTVTISDTAIETKNCSFLDDPVRDGVPFQLVATVENQTGEEIIEALWPSDFSFTDPDGLTVQYLDMGGQEDCDSEHGSKFVDLDDGETRRAALTMTAPAGATEMKYKPSTIEGAESVTWDVSGLLDEAATPDEDSDGPTPTPAGDSPEPAGESAGEVTATCAIDPVYQPGTTFYSDGTSGYTAACQQQMEDAMEASGNYPDYPFGNVDPNWTEEDAMRGRSYDDMSNAERSNHGFSAATPANCDGMQGAHEDSEALNC